MEAQLNDHKHARRARITRFEIARDTSWLPPSPVAHADITWNYTSWLDLVALVIASWRDSSFRGIRAGHSHLTNANTSPSPNSSINPIIAAMCVRVNERGKIPPCTISISSPNMNVLPYMGVESGTQLVPELSRLIGSARSIEDDIVIRSVGDGGECGVSASVEAIPIIAMMIRE